MLRGGGLGALRGFGCPQQGFGVLLGGVWGAGHGAHLLQGFNALFQQAVLGAEALGGKNGEESALGWV